MKGTHQKIFIGILLFWVLLAGGFIGVKEWTLRTGTEVLLAMRPVDPRDLFRGDYVTLSYEISRMDPPPSVPVINGQSRGPIYVLLDVDDDGIARAMGTSVTRPPEGLFIAGTMMKGWGGQINVEYGIESFFVPEGRGQDIQQNLSQMYARVVIDGSGRAVLKGLVYQGEDVRF